MITIAACLVVAALSWIAARSKALRNYLSTVRKAAQAGAEAGKRTVQEDLNREYPKSAFPRQAEG